MKQSISLPISLFVLLLITQSCAKQSRDEMGTITSPGQTIKASVSVNNPYILKVTNLGSVSVSKQAEHFSVSQTETDPKDGILEYKYIPQSDFTGTDEVELLSSKTTYSSGSENGCNGSGSGRITTENSNIHIKFTVTK